MSKSDAIDEEDLETLSYSKLNNMIISNHPVDPDSQEKFKIIERITVKDYEKKILDICGILKCLKL